MKVFLVLKQSGAAVLPGIDKYGFAGSQVTANPPNQMEVCQDQHSEWMDRVLEETSVSNLVGVPQELDDARGMFVPSPYAIALSL